MERVLRTFHSTDTYIFGSLVTPPLALNFVTFVSTLPLLLLPQSDISSRVTGTSLVTPRVPELHPRISEAQPLHLSLTHY